MKPGAPRINWEDDDAHAARWHMKRGAPRIDDDWDDEERPTIPLPGRLADGQPSHRNPRWGGRRRGSGRKPLETSVAQFVKLGSALTPRHVAFLDAHRFQFETASRSASLRLILDEYIASVPGLAAALDQIVTDRGGGPMGGAARARQSETRGA